MIFIITLSPQILEDFFSFNAPGRAITPMHVLREGKNNFYFYSN